MQQKITVHDNPSKQEKYMKTKEISFVNSKGEYYGLLLSLQFADDKPVINLYRIDEGIKVYTSEEREPRA